MHPTELEKRIELVAMLGRQAHHAEALAAIEDIKVFLPNSPVLLFMRVENLAALGRTNEALQYCERLMQRLNRIREAGDSLDDLLDIEQADHLAEMVTEQTDQTSTLKRTLDRRQADALDKETLQSTVSDLEAKLKAFLEQREKSSQEQKELLEELNSLRQKERSTTQALEQAYTELDELKTTLVQREAEISEAESELAEREQLVAKLENEVHTLQQRSENAVLAEEQLNEELIRLKKQGDLKSEELEKARQELEQLHQSLAEREQAISEAQAQNREQEEALESMRQEMQRIHEEADKAESAKETLQTELEQLRQNERDKSEALEAARSQLSSLQDQLRSREQSIAEAEARACETEREKASMREQLDEILKRAEDAAASELALAEEVALLRANEAEKAAELERTRTEMERMRTELVTREKELQEQIQRSESGSEAEKLLREELENLRGRAREFAESEKDLAQELEHLRASETEKSKVLDTARNEMDTLRDQLTRQQQAMAAAEEASSQYDAIVATLQQELDALKDQAQSASTSEQELASEVASLRENEAAKTMALAEAQAEMEQLKAQLIEREKGAREAEEENAQKQQELEQLHREIDLLRARTDETKGAESVLAQEISKLRQSEEEKNQELEQSRKELESLKQVLLEREDAAAKAAQEQASSREIIQKLESELSALRHKDLEQQSSHEVLQAEVSQIKDAVQRQGDLDDSPQAQKLKQIQEQLQTLEEDNRDNQQALREQAALRVLQESSQRQTAGEAETIAQSSTDSQLFALNYILESPSQTKTQKDALKLAQQQSQRQTQQDALKIAQQQSQRQTPRQAESVAQTSVNTIASQFGIADAIPVAGEIPSASDDDDLDVQEFYPKPRDAAFVFPDQSVSIAVKRRRSSTKVVVAAGLLCLIAFGGIAAFIAQGLLSSAPGDGEAVTTSEPGPAQEAKMLRMEFPSNRPFGTLYDTRTQPHSDAEWPAYAEAQGLVEYPEGVKFHLVVRRDHANDLSPFTKLPKNVLSSLWLPSFDMTEENLRNLHSLERVGVVYVDQELTERERERIQSGFLGSTTVTSKMPGAVMRDMTPPDKRVLQFPEESLGRVAIRRWNDATAPWQYYDAARGAVEIPARMEIQLQIGANVTDLSALSQLDETSIHTLVLEGQNITDRSMEGAASLRGLIMLEMDNTRVGTAGMEALIAVRGLQQIKISNTQIGDDAIGVFRDLPQLSSIEITNAPNLTAASLPTFRNLRILRRLHLQNTSISLEQLRQLDRDLPACAVTPI